MAPKKCTTCNKSITLKSPALICSRCNKTVHSTPGCSKLTNKQLAALRNSDGLEWSCEECLSNASRRSSYFVTAEDSSDEEEGQKGHSCTALNETKLIANISRETQRIIKAEIGDLTTAVAHMNGQMADLEDIVRKQEGTIKSLVNKNIELLNKNKNLELRVTALEQHINEVDQKMLSGTLEIAGIPETPNQDVKEVVNKLAEKLEVNSVDIVAARRLQKPKDRPQPGHIVVEVRSSAVRTEWINSAKNMELTAGSILSTLPKDQTTRRVFIREALTHRTKVLLYNAQQKLKDTYKYVWCKAGIIYVKKTDDKSRPHIIRSMADVDGLLTQ